LEVYAKANKQVLKDDIELLEGNRLKSEETKYILHVPMRVFFDASLNIAVFGDAGAGKTTTLQMYAKSLIQERRDGLVLFVSLASALSIFKGRSPSYFLTQSSPADLLVQAVCAYINHHAIGDTVDVPTLNKILLRKGGVLLLDGLDEVAKLCPWILEAIAEVPQKYKKLQVITSSRLTGDYVERIPFFGVTIKEFTDSQRDAFIQRWFGETPSPDDSKAKAASVLSHLATHQHVRDIVKNPLSATIMCVLAEKAIQLPQTEVQLYKERFRLLLGDYDLHKGIKRVETHHDTLYKVAVKLAFYLHSSNTRQGASEELQSEVLRILSSRYSPEVLIQAVGELADPCNVLVPMNIQGEYGFGHLRFQEYLAACEIITNRNINWVDYIYSDWWRGAMSLLAQMSDDIEFIFKAALDGSQFGRALPTLNAMLKDKSEKEIGRLDEWIRRINSNKEPSDEEIRERRYQQYRERKDLPLPGLDRDY
jgi:predicted NACHT family NTPase